MEKKAFEISMQVTGWLNHTEIELLLELDVVEDRALAVMRSCPAHAGTCRVHSVLPSNLPVSRCFKGCWIPLPDLGIEQQQADGQKPVWPGP